MGKVSIKELTKQFHQHMDNVQEQYVTAKDSIVEVPDYAALFAADLERKVIPLANEFTQSENHAKEFLANIASEEDETFDVVHSCKCGALHGGAYMEGLWCDKPECQSYVTANVGFRGHGWIVIPDELPPFINPSVYRVLQEALGSYKGRPLIEILVDPSAELPDYAVDTVGQGLTYLHANWENAIYFFLDKVGRRVEEVKQFLTKYKDLVFMRQIPLMDKSLHTIIKNGTIRNTEPSITALLKILTGLSTIVNHSRTFSQRSLDQSMANAQLANIEYSLLTLRDKLLGKRGHIRSALSGCRLDNTARCIIYPIVEESDFDEIHLPWQSGVHNMKLEILNFLINREKMSMEQALARWHRSTATYDPLIHDILKTLIEECRFKGLPILVGRTPSMRHGALQLVFVTRFESDPLSGAMGIHPSILVAPNGDFDGDGMSVTFLKEMDNVHKFMGLHPSYTMLGAETQCLDATVRPSNQAMMAIHQHLTS